MLAIILQIEGPKIQTRTKVCNTLYMGSTYSEKGMTILPDKAEPSFPLLTWTAGKHSH